MAVRTKLLAVGSVTNPGQKLVYETPVNRTAIVKDVRITSYFTAQQVAQLLGGPPSGARWILVAGTFEPQKPLGLPTWLVLPEHYRLYVNTGAVGELYYWISGTELDGETDIPTIPSFGNLVGQLPGPDASS